MPCKSDVELCKSLQNDNDTKKYFNLTRWLDHMLSFSDSEIQLFPALSYNVLKLENTKTINDKVCFYLFCAL